MKTAVRDEAKKLFDRLKQEIGGSLRAAEAYSTIAEIEAVLDGVEPKAEAHESHKEHPKHEHKPHGHK